MNDFLPEGILKAMEALAETTRPYQAAMDAIERNKALLAGLEDPMASKFDIIDYALTIGLFDDGLAEKVSELLAPYHEFTGAQAAIQALGSSFEEMIKPDVYASANAMAATMAELEKPISDFQSLQSAMESLTEAAQIVDTSWLRSNGAWLEEKDALAGLDILGLSGQTSTFSRLCELEHVTSLLNNTPERFTSAAAQIASITTALDRELSIGWKYDDLLSSARLVDDYCSLAVRQHELLQKSADSAEVAWRLNLLDAASKYVDRQIDWSLGFADAIANEEITESDEEASDAGPTALSLLPTHIGYTHRDGLSPSEGLEESLVVIITEKGKRIADNVLMINQLRLDAGEDRVFGMSETVVRAMFNLSGTVCSTEEQFGKIVDALFFVFYENIKHIKCLIGNGDEQEGDRLVRQGGIYQCLFDIKTIRNDYRHDLDHGKPDEIRKKLKSVGDCYKKYCGNRPQKPRDFKKLQERIYDGVIQLEEKLIKMTLSASK